MFETVRKIIPEYTNPMDDCILEWLLLDPTLLIPAMTEKLETIFLILHSPEDH